MESNDRQSRIEHLPWTKLGDAATWQTQLPRTKRLRYNPLRESMADVFSKKKRSQVMAAIRANGNKDTELRFAAICARMASTVGGEINGCQANLISFSAAHGLRFLWTAVSGTDVVGIAECQNPDGFLGFEDCAKLGTRS
jgi:hypothetical protein